MAALWFGLLAVMLAVYAVLDGFDFGVGVLHRFVARNDGERRQVLATIGPVWDGNEVWLLASGGVLFLTFPAAYAAGFSGFYLPLMVVLWLLILRGLSIELRSHEAHPLWRAFWDTVLQCSSVLMAIVLGAALGNVIRGVPLDSSGYFQLPLFGNFSPWGPPGVLDWYTTAIGILTLAILTLHGALYLVWKAEGPVAARALMIARRIWWVVAVLGVAATVLTWKVQPALYLMIDVRVWPAGLVAAALAGFLGIPVWLRRRRERSAFLGSAAFILGLLAATAAGLYPNILSSSIDPQFSITAQSAQAGAYGLRMALIWWVPGILLAVAYFAHLFWRFRGKVAVGEG